jgi:glycosyltransferase involved in cell wall biosynthesis
LNSPLFVSIGTVEPRKGYAEVLSAFESLWSKGYEGRLLIFGKAGWRSKKLQAQMRKLSATNPKFTWKDDASDAVIRDSLLSADALIMNSHAEGLGLPILEANYFRTPVIARDIPAFREIPSTKIFVASGKKNVEEIANTVLFWDSSARANTVREDQSTEFISWKEVADSLAERIDRVASGASSI